MEDSIAKAILDEVDERQVIAFQQAIVRIPSFTTEETPLATYIVDYMRQIGGGLEAKLDAVPLADGRISHNAVGRLPGSGGGTSLLLFGHLDHSPTQGRAFAEEELKGWKHDPFGAEIEDGWLYGKGSQDEKGGVTGLVMAAEALVRSGVKLKGDVYFVGVQGHKRVSSGTLHMLDQGLRTDFAINTENTGNMIVNAWVGRTEGKIHIISKELHFDTKQNFPQYRDQLTAFELMHKVQGALGPEIAPPSSDTWMTFEPHPELAEFPQIRMERIEFLGIHHLVMEFQIRTVPGMTDATIIADLERLLNEIQRSYPYLQTEIEWPSQARSRPAVVTPRDHLMIQRLAHWHEYVTGEPAEVSARARIGDAADGSHTSAASIDTILYGPGGGVTDWEYRLARQSEGLSGAADTGTDERVAIKDLISTAKIFALLAADLCG